MSILEEEAPKTEIYSIDEAFLNLCGVPHCMNFSVYGKQVRTRILRDTGLTVGGWNCTDQNTVKTGKSCCKKMACHRWSS